MTAVATPVRLAAGGWTAVPSRTRATFAVGNLGVKVVHGTIPVTSGRVDVDATGRPVSVRAELDLGAVDTAHRRRDADLRKPALLDLDAHPVMTFAGDVLRPDGEGWSAVGELRLRGTSCPLVVVGRLVEATGDGAFHVVGTGTLDRTAAGIRAPRFLIGRWVRITVDAWLTHTPVA
jgi:polyisoprenoid-binding protein YceI